VADLVRHAKANPGALTYASSGAGSLPHFNGEQLKVAAAIDMLHVPFNGLGQITPELIAGRINVAFLPLNVAIPLADASQARILANLDAGEGTSAAGLPSILETLPNFRRAPIWFGLLGPAGLPNEIAIKVRNAVKRAISETESARILFEKNFVRVLVDDQSRFRQSIQDDRATTLELIARIGIRAE
jgi:tripartite-type tricarboxylate transporter receptor subunit TctC